MIESALLKHALRFQTQIPVGQFFKSVDEEFGKCSNVLEEVAGFWVNGISGELWNWRGIESDCELRIQYMNLV